MYDPFSALTAGSGGRMGGRSFSSRSSSSSSSSRSCSAPRTRSGSDFGFSYSVPHYSPSPFGSVCVGPAVGVGSTAFVLMSAFAAFVLVSGFLSGGSGSRSVFTATDEISVVKLQVGLLGSGSSLIKDLNRIAKTADTSTPEDLLYVLTDSG